MAELKAKTLGTYFIEISSLCHISICIYASFILQSQDMSHTALKNRWSASGA